MEPKKIQRQRTKLARLEERIGYLMSQRAIEEDRLGEMIKAERKLPCYFCSKPVRSQREDGTRPTCLECADRLKIFCGHKGMVEGEFCVLAPGHDEDETHGHLCRPWVK